MLKILHILVAVVLLPLLSGCAITHNFGPYTGQVLDAETKVPIEGAVVFMECLTGTPNIAGGNSHYADFKEVLTDKKGEFHLELRVITFKLGHLWDPRPTVYIFKPGYGLFPDHRGTHADILVEGTSHVLPEDTYVTITLPELKTKRERRDNLRSLPSVHDVPFHKYPNLFRLKSIERVSVGLKPARSPR